MNTPNIHPADLLRVTLEYRLNGWTARCHGSHCTSIAVDLTLCIQVAAMNHINCIADICGLERMANPAELEVTFESDSHYLVLLPERFRLRRSAD